MAKTKTKGRTDRVKTDERQTVALLKASGLSNREIARQTNRARQTVATILKSDDVDRLRVQARDILDRSMPDISEQFLEAIKVGAAKGSGDSAYRALLSLNVISRPDDNMAGPHTVVNVGQVIVQGNGGAPILPEREPIVDGVAVAPDDGA